MQRPSIKPVLNTLKQMLDDGASVNFYMFFGGTNFGFTAGANDGGPGFYNADVTSYDYDAPMDEAGDPTNKFYELQSLIARYLPLPNITIAVEKKVSLGSIVLEPIRVLFSNLSRRHLGKQVVVNRSPLSFEALDQNAGFVLYETTLPRLTMDPGLLVVEKLRDRALIYVDRVRSSYQFVSVSFIHKNNFTVHL